MSTTLTNGLKLPDKGSVDWYADMQNNYAILDGAVGTVAEHTTALAGKAPAVHTHTKSDVTDLLNSNFIPSANNSYDLGTSTNQWKSIYAQSYYYNGTAWGLDKQNEWTNFNTFNGYRLQIKHTAQEIGVIPASNQWNGFSFVDKNKSSTLTFEHAFMGSGETRFKISMMDNYATHNSDSTVWIEFLRLYTCSDGSAFVIGAEARPLVNNTYNLGTSNNKWKTLNGINPGALSLPNIPGGSGTVNSNYIDLSGDITIRDASSVNFYTALCDGWIAINSFATWIQIADDTTLVCVTGAIGADGFGQCYLPVRKNDSIRIVINQTNTNFQSFKVIPCQGNV